MKKILLTNDDGFESKGLFALKEALSSLGHVSVVAPSSEKSACGHSLTLTKTLRFLDVDDDFYKLEDGTPSDCIYLALNTLFEKQKPDLIVSGINRGANMGEDITYSGTASAAMEGVLHGIDSIAISQVVDSWENIDTLDFTLAQESIYTLVKKHFEKKAPLQERQFLNVNIPHLKKEQCQGMKITHAGYRYYANDAHLHRNPRGEEHWWLGTHPLEWKRRHEEGMCDFEAIEKGFISLSPIKVDMSAYESIKKMEAWI